MTSSDDDLVVVFTKEKPLSEKELQMKLLQNLVALEEPCPFFKSAFEYFVIRKFKNYYPLSVVSAVYQRIHTARTQHRTQLYNPIESPSIVISDSDDDSSSPKFKKNFVDLTSSLDGGGEPRASTSSPSTIVTTSDSNVQIQVTNARIDSVRVTVNNIQAGGINGAAKKKRKSEPVRETAAPKRVRKTSTKVKYLSEAEEADRIRTQLLLHRIVELSVPSEEQNKPKSRLSQSKKRSR